MMRVFFVREHEQYKCGQEYFIERTLAIRLEAKGILETWPAHTARLEDEAADAAAKEKADAKKLKSEKLKADKKKTGTSKKAKDRETATTNK